ncbi:MAG TPA: hypothetical protein VNS46_04705 [Nocardioides sp.]|nr:hypothetical protein [Nocardioides sp.]
MSDETTDERWLREGLAGAVPEPPPAPDRADGARAVARRGRRTTAAVIGGVAASVLLVAGVAATVGGDDPARQDAADQGPQSPYDAPPCPATPVDTQTRVGPDHVPDGATSVRLCGGNEVPIEVPDDALVSDVDGVVAAVNGLEDKAPDAACTMELGPGYQLVFDYPDDEPIVVSGALYGCRDVVVNGVERTGADVPWEKFIDLLRAQRERLAPPAPADVSAIDCPTADETTGTPSVGRAQDLAVAALCVGGGAPAAIPPAELDLLLADIVANTRENAPVVDCASSPPFPQIVGLTAWGDTVEISSDCGDSRFVMSYDPYSVWTPAPEAAAVLERLAGEAR